MIETVASLNVSITSYMSYRQKTDIPPKVHSSQLSKIQIDLDQTWFKCVCGGGVHDNEAFNWDHADH